ncbi:MAG: ion transporter [Burkholderiales bacterium 35-55-47]|jgi:voltage-gated potassium channel|uniref:ion transporter n=1 Tax=Limnohabitans sp. TaxID=1907725 RepID=UPI000BC86FEC|nr:ion transporter [Limnohabitans sp.]OYY20076.1 MAG: ion transporter [Burkholderiales bacterium 35-55-47]OYZ74314.1 MAG: ion transporter [Burkholderiales bacterium 24-55-52]OZB01795.1 MAG: ion transporter [Burkholderiales bacterium 39-55-53]HQR86306.1 ion transporter [Limnohabitans sp.]HQS25777.1 ion transporter [Limnohabitans sp.]
MKHKINNKRIQAFNAKLHENVERPLDGWRLKVYTIIFEADTAAGRRFDIALIWAIVLSVLVVMADSVQSLHNSFGTPFLVAEWFFTLVFTAEYIARLVSCPKPLRYATSFFGVIDLLSLLPTYLALLFPELYALLDVRVMRLLRIFRVLKLPAYVAEYQWLLLALSDSRRKIMVFLSFVLFLVIVLGSLMYVVEGPENGFTSIPISIYWAITTLTTVGFGDITAKTALGQFIASCMMLIGWGTLAVPTGIVTAEMAAHRGGMHEESYDATTRTCHECLTEGHLPEAIYCLNCGAKLPNYLHD